MSIDHEFAGSRFLGKNFNLNRLKINDSSFVVASVEAGNTTTKCLLTSADLKTGKTEIIGKCVRLTREIQKPADESEVFGKTIGGTEITKKTLSELVRAVISQALFEKNLTPEDIHFVVRSTGITAETGDQLDMIIRALAEGCLLAGFAPRKMTGYLSLENMPEKLKPYCHLDKVYFDGAVAGVRPPAGIIEGVVSNEMEGELALAGLKEAAKHPGKDFRNPCIAIDMGTTLSGRVADGSRPYAKTAANFCGYAGAAADAFLQNIAPDKSAYEWKLPESAAALSESAVNDIETAAAESMKHIHVMKIPKARRKFGSFTVNADASIKAGTILFGCDVGENGSDLKKLSDIGEQIYKKGGQPAVFALMDEIMSEIAVRLIDCVSQEGLLTDETCVGITGRAGITGTKKEKIIQKLESRGILNEPEKKLFFAEDGLAHGAAVMARCMNSLGCPMNPIGGRRGDKCIMQERRELQNL
jgi:putative methanogenesis marker protein 14